MGDRGSGYLKSLSSLKGQRNSNYFFILDSSCIRLVERCFVNRLLFLVSGGLLAV